MPLDAPKFTVATRVQREDGLDECVLRLADETYAALTAALPNTGTACMMTARIVLPPEMMPLERGATVGFSVVPIPVDSSAGSPA